MKKNIMKIETDELAERDNRNAKLQKKVVVIVLSAYLAIFIIMIIVLVSFGCRPPEVYYDVEEIKAAFSEYESIDNTVMCVWGDTLFFPDNTLDLEEIVPQYQEVRSVSLYRNKIYIVTTEWLKKDNCALYIYRSDVSGENLETVFSRDGYNTNPSVLFGEAENKAYIEYHTTNVFDRKSAVIDLYNIDTGEYTNAAKGENCSLDDYSLSNLVDYAIRTKSGKDGSVLITYKDFGKQIRIDTDSMKQSAYGKVFERYPFDISHADYLTSDRVLLTFALTYEYGSFLNKYAHAVFEYNLKEDCLKYRTLIFAERDSSYRMIAFDE